MAIDPRELTQKEQDLLAAAVAFRTDYVEPHAAAWARQGKMPRAYFEEASKHGLCALLVPQELGGKGLSYNGLAAILSTLADACFSSTFALVVHNNLAANIARNGSSEHHAFLPAMIAGEKIGAFLLTEPGAGSDAAAISTTAKVSKDAIRLSGDKAWSTNGGIADLLSVYAQTSPGAGSKGIANYLVEAQTNGVQNSKPYDLFGVGAMNVSGFNFDNVILARKSEMIAPGKAFKAAMQGIDLARTMVAVMSAAMLQRSLHEAISYIKKRTAFGQAIANYQYPQHLLADVATDLVAANALNAQAVTALANDDNATTVAAHAKKFATKIALQRIADCMQIMGAAGALGEFPLSRHLACAKLAQYVDGTSEIQNVVIAREMFRAHES
ncbi:MAG: acyl-CoA dehydrogenase family protein [Pseudomonadota bacterium]